MSQSPQNPYKRQKISHHSETSSKISELSQPGILRIISYLQENGYATLKLTEDECSHIDPENFSGSMKYIIDQRTNLYYDTRQQHQLSGSCKTVDCPNCKEIAELEERLDQVVDLFSKKMTIVTNISIVLFMHRPQHENSEDSSKAFDQCYLAVSNMESIEKEVYKKDGSCFEGGYRGCVVKYLEKFVECIAHFDDLVPGSSLKMLECLNLIPN